MDGGEEQRGVEVRRFEGGFLTDGEPGAVDVAGVVQDGVVEVEEDGAREGFGGHGCSLWDRDESSQSTYSAVLPDMTYYDEFWFTSRSPQTASCWEARR